LCRSRRELSNAYLLAKIGVDTAENEPLEVWGENSIHYSLHSLVASGRAFRPQVGGGNAFEVNPRKKKKKKATIVTKNEAQFKRSV
jgi:hypothetical protein